MEWFRSQSPREQMMLVLGGIAVLIGALWFGGIKPLYDSLDQRRSSVSGNVKSIAWMERSAAEAMSLRGGGGPAADLSEAPLSAVANAFRRAGLPAPNRVDPVGDNGARVQVTEAPFDKLINVLAELESRAGLGTKSLTVNAVRPGVVSARITVER